MVWSATDSSGRAKMMFRNVDLTENDRPEIFSLTAKIRDVTDLSFYDSDGNVDNGESG